MQCPECGSQKTRVTSTFNHNVVMQRYRRCKMCDHRWKTWEETDRAPVRAKKPSTNAKAPDLFTPPPKKERGCDDAG